MTDDQTPAPKQSGHRAWAILPWYVRAYAIACVALGVAMAIANYVGWYPTFGFFSGENSMHSGYHGGYYGGGYGIHGK